ncbi:MAG TPA: haloacid dehalogenase type II [Casimicrobiaceae bacterium]|nr:haloacid dehalogenase type II [Casimicrobiaceae bacterium]
MLDAFVFDAYGTLFDVHSITALAETLAPRQGAALSQIWRTKQVEYTWLQSLMATPDRPREDFASITAHALDYAVAALVAPVDGGARMQLLAAYRALAPFPDAARTLERLAPRRRAILSNGTLGMLEPLVATSGLAPLLDAVWSVDAVDVYKPHPRVYQLAVDALQLAPARIGFVSANGWDAAGAKAFGFTTFWINRAGAPVERHGAAPDYVVGSLAEVAAITLA